MADPPRTLAVSIRVDGEWVPVEGLAPAAGNRIALGDTDERIVLATRVDSEWTTTAPDSRALRWHRAFGDLLQALADMCDAVRELDADAKHPNCEEPPHAG